MQWGICFTRGKIAFWKREKRADISLFFLCLYLCINCLIFSRVLMLQTINFILIYICCILCFYSAKEKKYSTLKLEISRLYSLSVKHQSFFSFQLKNMTLNLGATISSPAQHSLAVTILKLVIWSFRNYSWNVMGGRGMNFRYLYF